MPRQSFCDYYEILQISNKADLDTIERVYRLLAKKYHPDNKSTGSIEKFQNLTTGYKILSNPEKRAAYDVNYEGAKNHQWSAISKAYASDGFESDQHIRRIILSILYTKRREDSSDEGVGIVQLETLMEWPEETLNFHIWYLKEKKWIERTETGSFTITVNGVDKIEADGLFLRNDRLLTKDADISEDTKNIYLIDSKIKTQ